MSEPQLDIDGEEAESLFDFLDEEAADGPQGPAHRPHPPHRAGADERRPMPIIRKPVPVSESGPLRAPSAADRRHPPERVPAVRRADGDRRPGMPGGYEGEGGRSFAARARVPLLLLALVFLGVGLSMFFRPDIVSNLQRVQDLWTGWPATSPSDASDTSVATVAPSSEDVDRTGAAGTVTAMRPAASSLGLRFRSRLAEVEALVAANELDEAERAIASLDRSVYGYGIAEFGALEERIASLRAGGDPAILGEEGASTPVEAAVRDARAAELERAAERERQAEAERALEAEAVEAERQAEAERRAERARLAEAERLAAARRADEADRLAREERDRLRREQAAAARAEREAAAAQARAAAREAARLRAEGALPSATDADVPDPDVPDPSVERADAVVPEPSGAAAAAEAAERRSATIAADRRATDRRIAEQLAARERREAAERELAAQRQAERAARIAAEEELRRQSVATATSVGITDADLQLVYERFVNLVRAIENRDIASVMSLTENSGARVQQLMQVFENSESLDARITNVSARSADSSITGTLRIDTIRRADGSRVGPPPALQSVALTSTRNDGVWSAFDW